MALLVLLLLAHFTDRSASSSVTSGKAKERRLNEDVNRRELVLKLEEERKKAMELINATFAHLGMSLPSFSIVLQMFELLMIWEHVFHVEVLI